MRPDPSRLALSDVPRARVRTLGAPCPHQRTHLCALATIPDGRPWPLSRELARRATGSTLYILDEPTTGLHFDDVKKLLAVLHTLADRGNTVVVIEHHLDVIKTADHVIDLGPEGGDGGGRIVAQGTPEQVARTPGSFTGAYLAKVLDGRRGAGRSPAA